MIQALSTVDVSPRVLAIKAGPPVVVFLAILLAPAPEGLTEEGKRSLAVMALAVVLWATEALPIGVTGMLSLVLLVLIKAVADIEVALYGFSQPVPYFLIGILTLGLAVHKSGLAERSALYLVRLAGGNPTRLYVQMLISFALLTFALPSATTRSAILVHVYEQVMDKWRTPRESPLNRAVMMAMGSLNRLASTALLAGGITPVVASSLLSQSLDVDFSWTRWFALMALPFYAILVVGGAGVYLLYRSGFRGGSGVIARVEAAGPVALAEKKAALIAAGTALLWFTDFAHGLPPAVPALIALVVILTPGLGLLSWREFERDIGWSSFFVIATSLSLAHALIGSGAAAWFADTLVGGVEGLRGSPILLLLALSGAAAVVRVLMPSIVGYLAFVIPVAMATGASLGLNPLVCGLAVVIVGDSAVYYPAGSASSIFVFQRSGIRAPEVFRFGLIMTGVSIAVLFAIVLPYWSLIGEGLTR